MWKFAPQGIAPFPAKWWGRYLQTPAKATLMFRVHVVIFTMLALASTMAHAEPPVPQFQSGDVVALIGDSITHGRKWHRYVYSYYLTRFPDRQVRFVNLGIAGDSAGGALRRLDWDILPNQPNVAAIFLGMNDVGRGYYKVNADAQAIAGRERALANTRKNMDELAAKLLANGVPPRDVAKNLGVSVPTLYRWIPASGNP